MSRLFRNNGLSITVLTAFLAIWLGGQTVAGWNTFNAERRTDGVSELSFGEYVT
jgi:hypothetical protein